MELQQHTNRFSWKDGIDPATGAVTLNGVPLSVRDSAFLCYALIKQGNAERALPMIRLHSSAGGQSDAPLTDAALWLWSAGEYMNASGDRSFRNEAKSVIQETVERIEREWLNPQDHWLDPGQSGVFLTHLAMYYAGVQSVEPHLGDDKAKRLLKSIRELVFARFIKEGRVVSRLGDTAVQGDIVAAAIPFGMLGIEDRILIEALFQVEEHLVGKGVRLSAGDTYFGGCERPDATCLLAWYYANKGDTAKAKSLLERVEALVRDCGEFLEADVSTSKEPVLLAYWQQRMENRVPVSSLSRILYEIAYESLQAENESDAGKTDSVTLLHMPTGYDDPYVIMPFERFPRHPEAMDTVTVRLQTRPFHAGQVIEVHTAVNGAAANQPLRMRAETTPEGEKIWEAQIGPFAAWDEVDYTFVLLQGEQRIPSETFRFRVREWVPLDQAGAVYASEDRITVFLGGETGAGNGPVLEFRRTEAGTVRFMFDPDGTSFVPGDQVRVTEAALALEGGAVLEAGTSGNKLYWRLKDADGSLTEGYGAAGKSCLEGLSDGTGTIHKVRLNLKARTEHRWFGMGERYSHYEYSGQDVDHYVYNQYRDQGLKTYMPVPFAISSGRYSIFLDTPLYSNFRFHTRLSDLVEIEADLPPSGQRLDAYLFVGEPHRMIERFTNVTGKPVLPPKWAFGPWMSSNNWDSQEEVLKQAELTERYGIPSTVLVIEQWSDEATFYIFNDAEYDGKDGNEPFRYGEFRFPEWGRWPNPRQMVNELHGKGLKVLLWQIPIHKFMYGVVHEQRDRDELAMLDHGYCVRDADGNPYTLPYNWFKDCHILDFTNPDARDWWFGKRRYLVEEVGVDGFKTDGGEFVFGHDLQFHDGSTGREMRNVYPNLYVGSYYDFVQKYAPEGGITFSRAGYTGAQRYPLHWAGDERSTFQAFRSSVIAGLTSGMSGIPFWGWDLGGFHGDIPTAELFVRGAEMAAFCPVMQYHAESKGEFNQDRTPWNIAERTGRPEVIDLYKRYADIRMNLLPYVYDQAVRTSRSGVPMMRAMALEFPDDARAAEMVSQYMFGESLLVAPVTEEGHCAKDIYFPEGSWLSLFSSEEVSGGRYMKVRAGLEDIPVYMKQDSIAALNLPRERRLGGHVGNRVDGYEQLCFYVYIKEEALTSFEDDLGYTATLEASREADGLRLSWSGNKEHNITFIIRNQGQASSVTCNGQPLALAPLPEDLHPDSYCIRGGDLYLCVEEKTGTLVIRT